MRRSIILFAFLTISWVGYSQNYNVATLPETLKKNANVIVRERNEKFIILAKDRATHSVHEVFTILNEKGKRYATKVLLYSPLQKITKFKGTVYDANGKEIRHLKSDDIYDQSAISGFSLYEDNRLKAAELAQGVYPYTAEFEYETEYKYLFYIPRFSLVHDEKVAVEKSRYTIQSPKKAMARYKLLNHNQQPIESIQNDIVTREWNFDNTPAFREESFSAELVDHVPGMLFGPTEFSFENYTGTMDSWANFGTWISSLSNDRKILPIKTKNEIEKITSGLPIEDKIKTVYEYLQSKTRYVSIQIGIGGFQPFSASVVDESGYGDCKALSNYTVSLLAAAGVKANYVLIQAGSDTNKMITDFPSSQFNHAVVAVPNGKDTLWLECTSQTNPFGYMGTFTGDRKALMITDGGAKVVHTPRYSENQNVQSRIGYVDLDVTGGAKATVITTYSGLQYEKEKLNFVLNSPDEQKKWIYRNTHVPNFDINNFSFANNKERIPSAIVSMDLYAKNYATSSGKRLFLNPNLMNRSTFLPGAIDHRTTPVITENGFVEVDTLHFKLPDGIYPEFIPPATEIKSVFGEYENSYHFDQGVLLYIRRIKIHKGVFPAESYTELINFYNRVGKSDQAKIVFLSKT